MCGETELACGSACVPEEQLCDGIDDCPMGEDEGCDDFDEPDADDEEVAAGMTLAPEDEEDPVAPPLEWSAPPAGAMELIERVK